MTYIPRRNVTELIENKFEAIRVLALECRRLNDELRAREESTDRKITSMAVERLFDGRVRYFDARERREQERSEAMLAAAEGMLDAELLSLDASPGLMEEVESETVDEAAAEEAVTEEAAEASSGKVSGEEE